MCFPNANADASVRRVPCLKTLWITSQFQHSPRGGRPAVLHVSLVFILGGVLSIPRKSGSFWLEKEGLDPLLVGEVKSRNFAARVRRGHRNCSPPP